MLLERHEILVSNGLLTESFQPSLRSFNGMSAQMRRSLIEAITPKLLRAFFRRPDAMGTLKANEAKVLTEKMFAAKTQSETMDECFDLGEIRACRAICALEPSLAHLQRMACL